VFPRGLAGAPGRVARGRRDNPAAIAQALAELSGDGPPLLPRGYVNWTGGWLSKTALAQVRRIAEAGGPPPDLVLCYRDKSGDVAAWERFVTRVVSDYGRRLAAVQAAPDPVGFWSLVRDLGGADFAAALDYAGIDVYVDVFGPRIGVERVADVVGWVLRTFREQTLPIAGIPAATPIRICENGWPTGPDRPEATQARVLEATLRAVHDLRAELNVTHWELFTLRDANSSKDDMFYRFGVLRDDYSAKPAFGMLRDLIAELRQR